MPYWRHLKSSEPECGDPFGSVQEAREGIDPKTHVVTFVATEDEQREWTQRERDRFYQNEYISVPWVDTRYYRWSDARTPSVAQEHYPHLSLKFPGLIAYTKSVEHGVNDRQTRIKPGKYLAEFYTNVFSAIEIEDYIARCKAENMSLKIARDADTIARVYINGPNSCMGGSEAKRKGSPFTGVDTHPTRVYGDSDLAVAYMGDPETRVTARAVIWPEKQAFSRIYGDITLGQLLRNEGYDRGSFDGATIQAIRVRGSLLMPYIDSKYSEPGSASGMYALQNGDKLVLSDESRRGAVSCAETDGYVGNRNEDEDDHEDENNRYMRCCDHCNAEYDSDRERTDYFCQSCEDERYVCNRCDRTLFDDSTSMQNGELWCDRCVEDATVTCSHTWILNHTRDDSAGAGSVASCDTEFVPDLEFSQDELERRERMHVETMCRDHAEGMQVCQNADCSQLFHDTEPVCPHCAMPVRCEHTADLWQTPDYMLARSPYYRPTEPVAEPAFPRYFTHSVGSFDRLPNNDGLLYIRCDSAEQSRFVYLNRPETDCNGWLLSECLFNTVNGTWIELTDDQAFSLRYPVSTTVTIDTSVAMESPF